MTRWRPLAGPLILIYHRVSDAGSPASGLSVTPEHFAEHLAVLCRRFEPRRLEAVLAAGRRLRRPAVAVTFDDGYADVLHRAKPLLERFGVPATVFVSSGALGGREFWWDELERLVAHDRPLPERLPPACGLADEHAAPDRRELYASLHRRLRDLDDAERRRALDALAAWSGGPPPPVAHRTLAEDELVELADGDLVEIGAHGVGHEALAALSRERQRSEVADSRARLEAIVGRPVRTFAFPYGGADSFTDESVALVREAGFTCAFTSVRGVVERSGDRFRVPRCGVRDWDGAKLARRLASWGRR